jgi:hypothetical protein
METVDTSEMAPILIATLNRYEHFKDCVSSLAMCKSADKTELYIALDYPLEESHWQGYNRICEYIPKISGFKDIIVIKRTTNYGTNKNFSDAINLLFESYGNLIISEDDNIFSRDFLDFVNKGLKFYQNREDIFSISGYQYPIQIPQSYGQDVYLWQGYSAWGVGIWRDKWQKVIWEREEALEIIKNFLKRYKSIYHYHNVANHYIPAKLRMIEQNRIHGDGYFCLHQYINRMYSVFPVVSRVRNMGHDGSGTGCAHMEHDIYAKQEIYSGEVGRCILPVDLHANDIINKVLAENFRTPWKSKIKTMGKILLLNFGIWPSK